uniref:Uncharacterized protein n=1 Tax=Rhizophora mucronata TaxID=61149 RepID=A0A2P2LLZ5_RHIMU
MWTLSSQALQRAASSAAQNTTAAALSQESQRVRIILSHSHFSNHPRRERKIISSCQKEGRPKPQY